MEIWLVFGVLFGCLKFIEKDKPKVVPLAQCCGGSQVNWDDASLSLRKLRKPLGMEKLVYVAAACGQPLPPGTQCGSKIVFHY